MKTNVKRAHVVLRLVWESVQFAVSSLKGDKFRTLLSLLGVTVGIFLIVLVLSVISGLKKNIEDGMDSLRSNTITVQREPWDIPQGEEWNWWKYAKRPPVDISDYEYILQNSTLCGNLAFFTTAKADMNYFREGFSGGDVVCVKGDFGELFSIESFLGRWFSQEELHGGQSVYFLGADVAESLFGEEPPVGKRIKVKGVSGVVIGVAPRQGESMAQIFDVDQSVFVPYGFGERIFGPGSGGAIVMNPKSDTDQEALAYHTRELMRSHRRLSPAEEDNFSINKMTYLTSAVEDIFRSVNLAGWIIGGFALLIGAFGIANIMFVSVRERMPQIGIQKGLGAPDYIIMTQFLSESAVLSFIGGGFGILIVLIISLILGKNSAVPFDLNAGIVAKGMLVALLVGILSGIIPAYSAARMEPVKAMNL
jgi:putative ABC transport system permease protein